MVKSLTQSGNRAAASKKKPRQGGLAGLFSCTVGRGYRLTQVSPALAGWIQTGRIFSQAAGLLRLSARSTRQGVIGISWIGCPIALATAFAMACMLQTIGPSPTSLAPNGP